MKYFLFFLGKKSTPVYSSMEFSAT